MTFDDFNFITQIYSMVESDALKKRDFDEVINAYHEVDEKIIEPLLKENPEKAREFERVIIGGEVYSEMQGYIYGFVSAYHLLKEMEQFRTI